jgi:protein-disulfide isomerase-like protein with CxxC motif
MVEVLYMTDPGCPWAWSASPAVATLYWRYGDGLSWRLVMIGLTERAEQYEQRGYTPLASALGQRRFHRYGMPFAPAVKRRMGATGPACRAVVATRLRHPGREWTVLRALQCAQFTTRSLLDEPADIEGALWRVDGIDAAAVVAALDDDDVVEAYEADRELARTAQGTPAEVQGRTAQTDGPVRFTAPSLVFTSGGTRLIAGGFQPVEAYDILLAHMAPELPRREPASDVREVLAAFPDGLFTAEVAAIMAPHLTPPDIAAAEDALIEAVAAGACERIGAGSSALWREPGDRAARLGPRSEASRPLAPGSP